MSEESDDAPDREEGASSAESGVEFREVTAQDEQFFDLLATRGGREVLSALTMTPMPVTEIAEECDVSQATVYRHLETLSALGIVVERTTIGETGGRRTLIRLSVTEAAVTFTQSLQVSYVPTDPLSRFEWLLQAFSEVVGPDRTHDPEEGS
jgi:DNA-binding transcriptional ArsR family regulator